MGSTYTVIDFAGRTVGSKSRKDLAVKFAVAQDADHVLSPAGKPVWTNPAAKTTAPTTETTEETKVIGKKKAPVKKALAKKAPVAKKAPAKKVETAKAPIDPETGKRIYTFGKRAKVQPESAITGRFELETYGKASDTKYGMRPDATLRALLGIKWRELWALGITQKKASEILGQLDSGELVLETYRAGVLSALDLLEQDEVA